MLLCCICIYHGSTIMTIYNYSKQKTSLCLSFLFYGQCKFGVGNQRKEHSLVILISIRFACFSLLLSTLFVKLILWSTINPFLLLFSKKGSILILHLLFFFKTNGLCTDYISFLSVSTMYV